MLISYPILGLGPTEVFADSAIEKISGTYPVTPAQAWHGGSHITFPATGGNEARAIADGAVVAYRIPTEKPKDAATLDNHPLNYCGWTDDGFVLLKHEKESGERTKVVFFSLYMHLSELPKSVFKGSPGAVQNTEAIHVKRKQKIGKLGSAYGLGARMHLEVFTDDTSLNAFFRRGKEKYKTDAKGCGESDLWGDTHFVIPAGTTYFSELPGTEPPKTGKKTDETICITVQYKNGDRSATAYRENGEQIGRQTDAEFKDNKGYEYNLYKLAQKRFPTNTSAGYELLRHGRVYGPDPVPAGSQNWQYIPLGFGRHGWVDLNQAPIKKLSDADFPYWKWKLIQEDSGVFNPDDCKCEIAELLQAIDPDQDGIAAPLEFKWLHHNKDAAERMKYLVCRFPSEWDASDAEKKWGWLKEYFKNPAVRRKELAEKHKKWIDGVKTRTENLLKTSQSDLAVAQEAKKEKQDTVAELQKKVAELTKQGSSAEAKVKVLEKEIKQKKKAAKPEDMSNLEKKLDDAQKALDENKAEKQKAQDALAEAEQQIKDINVAIQKLQSKIQELEATIKAVPRAIESADSEIKAAEAAMKSPATNVDPEKSWKEFKAHMNALQWWDKVKPLPSSTVWHFHPLAFIDHFRKCDWLSQEEFERIYPDNAYPTKALEALGKTPASIREMYRKILNRITEKYFICTPARKAHFYGQGAVESYCLALTIEGAVDFSKNPKHASFQAEADGYYSPSDPKNYLFYLENKLGNIEPGDGPKFRGRGMKQLTGRENYSKYWVYRGWLDSGSFKSKWWSPSTLANAPKIPDPERLSVEPYSVIDAGGWYWEAGSSAAEFCSINRAITTDTVNAATIKKVTYAVNGGYNGLDERIKHTLRIAEIVMD